MTSIRSRSRRSGPGFGPRSRLGYYTANLQPEEQQQLLRRLTDVEAFERFLHQTYLGQKRFSIEGTDALVPMLDTIIHDAAGDGVREVILGSAHRGRLNVLAHVLGKPYAAIIAAFEGGKARSATAPSESSSDDGVTGDVKYHLGAKLAQTADGALVEVPLVLAPNPSHLEFVDPVVEGMVRATQDQRTQPGPPPQDRNRSLAILLHGDAAFPGQGIVAETLNLSGLPGYSTGGTIHIIVNNQVGFTTDTRDSRSTLYAGDLAKGFEIPVVHVNADDPLSCLSVARLATAYRQRFGKGLPDRFLLLMRFASPHPPPRPDIDRTPVTAWVQLSQSALLPAPWVPDAVVAVAGPQPVAALGPRCRPVEVRTSGAQPECRRAAREAPWSRSIGGSSETASEATIMDSAAFVPGHCGKRLRPIVRADAVA